MHGDRKFYDIPSGPKGETDVDAKTALSRYVEENVIGKDSTFKGPFGVNDIVYCDHVASSKPLQFIEDFIASEVLPTYANTHTTSTVTSLQTTLYRHEARDILRNAVKASEHDAVIFVANGCTGAVHKLINALRLEKKKKMFVLVGPHEHHSNLLPWREIGAEIIIVKEKKCGCIDLQDLEQRLAELPSNCHAIGCFAAVSNITGHINDDLSVTATLHRYGALSFWDYATAAPYVNVDMNPKIPDDGLGLCIKDAIYFSMHKFIGGPQTPGVLVVKRHLFQNPVPANGGGGGSVFFVTEKDHSYLRDAEVREEGGTPAIIESVRAGLVMQLKQAVGSDFIVQRESEIATKILERLSNVKSLCLLGNAKAKRLPVISFLIRSPDGSFLHYNFTTSLLNDLYGIQTRGGCACAGPYAQRLLGLSIESAKDYEAVLREDSRLDRTHLRRGPTEYSSYEVLRPGFTRLNFAWFASDEVVDYVLNALEDVAEHGWKLLPQYKFNNETGEWRHYSDSVFKERKWLGNVSYLSGKFQFSPADAQKKSTQQRTDVKQVLDTAPQVARRLQVPDQTAFFQGEAERLRWFMLPIEARNLLSGGELGKVTKDILIQPRSNSNPCQCGTGSLIGPYHVSVQALKGVTRESSWNLVEEESKPTNVNDEKMTKDVCFPIQRSRDLEIKEPTSSLRWHAPPKDIFKPFLEAMAEFSMVQTGDRVLVCLSGGKDSLSLLHAMRQYQFYVRKSFEFELGAVTVDPGSSAYDPRPLIPYLERLGIPYFYEEQPIMSQAMAAQCSSICAYCSRMKRGRIYATARRHGYNVLAMGQHLDDLAESFLMSIFHNGRLRTMKANYSVVEKDLRVIRPFAYVREKNLRHFAETKKLPVIPENCPACFEVPKERHRTKQLLANQELLYPKLYWSLKSALYPLMNIRSTGIESSIFGRADDDDEEEDDEVI